jgi:hypothetical protein
MAAVFFTVTVEHSSDNRGAFYHPRRRAQGFSGNEDGSTGVGHVDDLQIEIHEDIALYRFGADAVRHRLWRKL